MDIINYWSCSLMGPSLIIQVVSVVVTMVIVFILVIIS